MEVFARLIIGINLSILTLAVLGLLVGLVYFVFRETRRITAFKRSIVPERISRVLELPSGSTSESESKSRGEQLLRKFRASEITKAEALELREILEKEKEEAQKKGNAVALVVLILNLAFLDALIAARR